jgi:hypothetical protein
MGWTMVCMSPQSPILARIFAGLTQSDNPHDRVDRLQQKLTDLRTKRANISEEIAAAEVDEVEAVASGRRYDHGHVAALRGRQHAIQAAIEAVETALAQAEGQAKAVDVAALRRDAAAAADRLLNDKAAVMAHIVTVAQAAKIAGFQREDLIAAWESLPLVVRHPLHPLRVRAVELGVAETDIVGPDAPRPDTKLVRDLLPAVRRSLAKDKALGGLLDRADEILAWNDRATADLAASQERQTAKRAEANARYSANLARAAASWFQSHQPGEIITEAETFRVGQAIACELRNVLGAADPVSIIGSRWAVKTTSLASDHGLSGIRTWSADKLLVAKTLGLEVQP